MPGETKVHGYNNNPEPVNQKSATSLPRTQKEANTMANAVLAGRAEVVELRASANEDKKKVQQLQTKYIETAKEIEIIDNKRQKVQQQLEVVNSAETKKAKLEAAKMKVQQAKQAKLDQQAK